MSKLRGSPKEQCADSESFQHALGQGDCEPLGVKITSEPIGANKAHLTTQDCSS